MKLSAARDFSLNVCTQCTILSIRCKLLLELMCVELRDAGQLIHNVWCAPIRCHVFCVLEYMQLTKYVH